MSDRYYIHCMGGLGDHLVCYFTGRYKKTGFGFLQQIKQEQPDSHVKLITHAVQDQIYEFFKYNPMLASIDVLPWRNPNYKCENESAEAKGYTSLVAYATERGWKRRPNRNFQTDSNDIEIIQKVLEQGPYVVIHPFAADTVRTPIRIGDYQPIVDQIIDQKRLNVVIVGGSYQRLRNPDDPQFKTEQFSYERPGLINLVDKINSRIAVYLICESKMLIATNSGFLCTASRGDVPLMAMSVTAQDTERRIKSVFLQSHLVSVVPVGHKLSAQENVRRVMAEIDRRM